MKKAIYCTLLMLIHHAHTITMHQKPSEAFIAQIATYATISTTVVLTTEGKKININTDLSGTITAGVSNFCEPKVRHSINSPTKLSQTIILKPDGTNDFINHNK